MRWRILSTYERHRRYERAKRANLHVFRIAHVGTYADFSRKQRHFDTYQGLPSRTALGRKMPPLFGSAERTQILALLWLTGPITVRELARARRVDSSGTFRTIDRLIESGLVVKATAGKRYIGLNHAHPARHALGVLLSALVQHYGMRFPRLSHHREALPTKRITTEPAVPEDRIFGSAGRSHLILLLGAIGSADVQQLRRLLGQNYASAFYSLKALEGEQIVRSQRVGARRVYVLSDAYPGGIEYRRFVTAARRALPRYQALADAVDAVTTRYR